MKRFIALLLVLLLLAGCGEGGDSSLRQDPSDQGEASEGPPPTPPEGPPARPADEIEEAEEEILPEPEPLERLEFTVDEAKELLRPGENGSYDISDRDGLAALSALVNAGDEEAAGIKVRITGEIDLSGIGFVPIGSLENPFSGEFDGGGNILRGLTVQGSGDGAGLFGAVAPDGRIEDVHIVGGYVSGRNQVGGIAGQNQGEVFGCSFRGDIRATGNMSGGICGELGNIAGGGQASGSIRQCAVNGVISGNGATGGLCGFIQEGAVVSDCYVLGTVSAIKGEEPEPQMIGGLCGEVGGVVERCYTSIELYTRVSSRLVGAFAGYSSGKIDSCFYNEKPVENWKGVGYAEDEGLAGVTGCTVEEITEASTYNGWDLVTVWSLKEGQNRGLPYLRIFLD